MTDFSRICRRAALVGLIGAWGAGVALAQPRAPAAPLQIQAVSAQDSASGAEVTLRLDGAAARGAAPRAFILAGPHRLVIDAPAASLARQGQLRDQAGMVAGIRHGALPQGGVRVVLDLTGPAEISAPLAAVRGQPGAFRLSLRRPGQTAAAAQPAEARSPASAPVRAQRPAPAPTPVVPPALDGGRIIVIDAGHGGRDPGAIGRRLGLQEKQVTLKAAQMLAEHLRQLGDYTVVMTRDRDRFLELEDRVGVARAQHADLFISLHADSHADARIRGASVYTLSERGARRARREMDRQDWEIDLGEDARPAIVQQILVDLTQRETKNRSADFAQTLIPRLGAATPLLRNTHRSAGFFVLLAPDVPAVLIELGFLSNREDEARLADDRRLRAKARAIARAVDDFFAERGEIAQR